jgi:hypothetical protein
MRFISLDIEMNGWQSGSLTLTYDTFRMLLLLGKYKDLTCSKLGWNRWPFVCLLEGALGRRWSVLAVNPS